MIASIRTFAAIAVTAALLYGMQGTTPYYSDIVSYAQVQGKQGKRVETSSFATAVVRVHLARELVVGSSFLQDHALTTTGIWVVVEAAAEAVHESMSLSSATWLARDGVRYQMSSRPTSLPGTPGTEQLEPGIPRPVLMVFEVPEEQLAGASLIVHPLSAQSLGEEARVELDDMPSAISSRITIKFGGRVMPWRLEFL